MKKAKKKRKKRYVHMHVDTHYEWFLHGVLASPLDLRPQTSSVPGSGSFRIFRSSRYPAVWTRVHVA